MNHLKKNCINKTLIAVAVCATFYLSGCGEEVSSSQGEGFNQTKNTNTDFNQAQLITSLVDNVITPTIKVLLN